MENGIHSKETSSQNNWVWAANRDWNWPVLVSIVAGMGNGICTPRCNSITVLIKIFIYTSRLFTYLPGTYAGKKLRFTDSALLPKVQFNIREGGRGLRFFMTDCALI